MGRYKDGINGAFKGKVGSVVGCSWKGINYMRSLPKTRTSTVLSEAEQANRQKFTIAHAWLKPLKDVIRLGFKNYSPTIEGFLAAKSYLLKMQ